jgi:hypothetical protein
MSSNHPLPAPPGQQQQHYQQYQQYQQQERPSQQRPRAKSGFSFRSNHSHKSSGSSGHKIDLHETHEEKQSRRLTTKADPSMAITEAEPCEYNWRIFSSLTARLRLMIYIAAVASEVRSSLAPIRAIQHRDNQGNPIGWFIYIHPYSDLSTDSLYPQPTLIDPTLHEADGRDLLIQSDHSKRP